VIARGGGAGGARAVERRVNETTRKGVAVNAYLDTKSSLCSGAGRGKEGGAVSRAG